MLTVETLHSLVIEPKKPPVVEHVESSVMTDEQQVCDQATDVMERRSVAVGTEVDETKTIRLVESLLRETANSNRIFDRLRPFHTNSLVRLQPIRSSTISTLIGEALPVSSMSCGSAGRTAILIGENEHETWCSHSGRVVIAQRSRWRSLTGVLCDRKIPEHLKSKIYRTVVRPVAIYGAECWPATKEVETRLSVMETKMLRWTAGVTRMDRIRNDAIRQKFGVAPIADKMREARLRWYGHVLRGKEDSVRKIGLELEVAGKRPRGRPKQRVMAVGDVAGDVHLVFGDTVLSTIKVHSQAVSSLDWTPHSQLVSCGTDGHIAVLQLKGTSLEIGKSLRLSVSDLPRRIRKSSSSAKSLSIVAMSRFGEDLCVASETGGLWLVSMPDLRLKTIASEPQAIQSVLYLPPLIALCGDDESTALLLNDGSFVDALPIAGVHQCKVDNELLVLADGTRMLIYDVTTRTVMFDEKRPTQSMSVSPQGDLVVLNENELVTFRLMKDNA
ncbi:unnamed protein product [Heligmosomoides polygyrus]|uniref:WD_REPEATS_REGION domain-containing protein n=1 Tax=Heligmosomoides polygyrus TaxID=6339 RepID=A0A183GLM6_HELPZ|nr:unnamed protein product [Heligmosomoides polygyrus]